MPLGAFKHRNECFCGILIIRMKDETTHEDNERGSMISAEEQFRVIASGAAQIIPEKALMEKLERNKPLNIKLGVDPTAPDLHLGHAVPLRKLRAFQDLGHQSRLSSVMARRSLAILQVAMLRVRRSRASRLSRTQRPISSRRTRSSILKRPHCVSILNGCLHSILRPVEDHVQFHGRTHP